MIIIACNYSCEDYEVHSINIIKSDPIGWDRKEDCKITYSDTKKGVELKGKIKYRGGISRRYHKHSFSLELDKKHSFSRHLKDDDWILNANYIDKTFMRHKISYDLFREMNDNNVASKSTFVNMSVNDSYKGLYVLMEKISLSVLDMDKTDSMAMLFKDPPIFYKDNPGFAEDSLNTYNQKFPKIKSFNKTAYVQQFKDFLFHSTDSAFAKGISNWVDLDNVIDWHIMLLFSNNEDGIMKNFYLYKKDKDTPFRFAIWDYDHSYGRDGDNEYNMMRSEVNCNRAILFERLSKLPSIKYNERLKKRWLSYRQKNIISVKNFERHIKKNDRMIKSEVLKNSELWPLDNKWYFDANTYTEELELMRKFLKIRIVQLDKYFTAL